ncbi:MAG TPA: SRPBCC domain-containing protein [Ktedonobacterales bacterium]
MATPDKIEREITIDAPIERVWALVAEPGWWIGDGDPSDHRHWREGELEVVEDPRHGRFPIRIEAIEPPHYIAYHWAFAFPGEEPHAGNSTRVEFWLSEQDGGILLRVVESGFTSLAMLDEKRNSSFDGNVKGWMKMLDALKMRAEHILA